MSRWKPGRGPRGAFVLALATLVTGCAAAMVAEEEGRMVSDFASGVTAATGGVWHASTDSLAGGRSRVELHHSVDGAAGSAGSLEITGTIGGGLPYAWAGAIWYPGGAYHAPGDLSDYRELRFWARGAGGTQRLLVMWQGVAGEERRHPESFETGASWAEHVLRLDAIPGFDPTRTVGILFTAGPAPGRSPSASTVCAWSPSFSPSSAVRWSCGSGRRSPAPAPPPARPPPPVA
jgi:Carbohydrate binding domain (family 11)